MTDCMMERGEVVALEGELAKVQVRRMAACSGCQNKRECGVNTINDALGAKHGKVFSVYAKNSASAKVGDQVEVALPSQALLKMSLMAYAMPVVLLLFGAALGQTLGGSEPSSILGALLGAASGIMLLRRFSRPAGGVGHEAVILRSLS